MGLGAIAERVHPPYLTTRPDTDVVGITSRVPIGPAAEPAGYVQRADTAGRLRLAAGTLVAGDATGQFAMHRPLDDPDGCALAAERTLPTHRLTGKLLAPTG